MVGNIVNPVSIVNMEMAVFSRKENGEKSTPLSLSQLRCKSQVSVEKDTNKVGVKNLEFFLTRK
jgi:hypothetical protein